MVLLVSRMRFDVLQVSNTRNIVVWFLFLRDPKFFISGKFENFLAIGRLLGCYFNKQRGIHPSPPTLARMKEFTRMERYRYNNNEFNV